MTRLAGRPREGFVHIHHVWRARLVTLTYSRELFEKPTRHAGPAQINYFEAAWTLVP